MTIKLIYGNSYSIKDKDSKNPKRFYKDKEYDVDDKTGDYLLGVKKPIRRMDGVIVIQTYFEKVTDSSKAVDPKTQSKKTTNTSKK